MQIDKNILQSNLELLLKCSSPSVNEDQSDKVLMYADGLINISRKRLWTHIPMDTGVEGIFHIENLLKILKAVKADTIDIGFEEDELKMSFNKNKMTFKSLVVENWKSNYVEKPLQYFESVDSKLNPISDKFFIGLSHVLQCASTDKNGSILSNVAIFPDHIIASDNYTIGHYKINTEIETPFLIDTYNVQPIIDCNPNQFAFCEDRIVFKGDFGNMICAIHEIGKYPDFKEIITKTEKKGNFIEFPEELSSLIYITQQIPGKTDDSQITISIGKNKLGLDYRTFAGQFKRNIRMDYNGNSFSFKMNLNTLSNGLKALNKGLFISKNDIGMMKTDNFRYIFPIEIED